MPDIYEIQLKTILGAYESGRRTDSLGDQPASWLVFGLNRLQNGDQLSAADLQEFAEVGSTNYLSLI